MAKKKRNVITPKPWDQPISRFIGSCDSSRYYDPNLGGCVKRTSTNYYYSGGNTLADAGARSCPNGNFYVIERVQGSQVSSPDDGKITCGCWNASKQNKGLCDSARTCKPQKDRNCCGIYTTDSSGRNIRTVYACPKPKYPPGSPPSTVVNIGNPRPRTSGIRTGIGRKAGSRKINNIKARFQTPKNSNGKIPVIPKASDIKSSFRRRTISVQIKSRVIPQSAQSSYANLVTNSNKYKIGYLSYIHLSDDPNLISQVEQQYDDIIDDTIDIDTNYTGWTHYRDIDVNLNDKIDTSNIVDIDVDHSGPEFKEYSIRYAYIDSTGKTKYSEASDPVVLGDSYVNNILNILVP